MATLPETDIIIFYDIPSSVPDKVWSPNTWKTRLATIFNEIEADNFHTGTLGTS